MVTGVVLFIAGIYFSAELKNQFDGPTGILTLGAKTDAYENHMCRSWKKGVNHLCCTWEVMAAVV
jgi:hypothetical protein